MEHEYIMAEELFRTVSPPATAFDSEQLDRFNKVLQLLCTGQRDCIRIFRTLRYTRIRLYALQKILQGAVPAPEQISQLHFLEIAIGYIDTELELLNKYRDATDRNPPEGMLPWTGTLVELVELVYGMQEMGCIGCGDLPINEITAALGRFFGLEIKDSHCYNAYLDMKRRKNDSRTYFLDTRRERRNMRMWRDDEKERKRR